MRGPTAVAGSTVHLVIAPGVVAGLGPWLLTDWRAGDPRPHVALEILGAVLVGAGILVLLGAFARFVMEGRGTPAPIQPTEQLVIGGLYRYVRNPMYIAVVALIVGQALMLGRPVLVAYAAAIAVAQAAFVRAYEEPALRRQFGAQYDAYRDLVPAWLPRWRRAGGRIRRHPS